MFSICQLHSYVARNLSLAFKSTPCGQNGTLLEFYVPGVNHSRETNVTGYVTQKMGAEILRYAEPLNMSPLGFAEALWLDKSISPRTESEYEIEVAFMAGLLR